MLRKNLLDCYCVLFWMRSICSEEISLINGNSISVYGKESQLILKNLIISNICEFFRRENGAFSIFSLLGLCLYFFLRCIWCQKFLKIMVGLRDWGFLQSKNILFFGKGIICIWVSYSNCINYNISAQRLFTDTNISVSDCVFVRINQLSDNGGIVFVYGGSYSLNVSETMFLNCSSSINGGAIYFVSYNCELKMICAFRCSASNYGQYSYIITSTMSIIEYNSVTSSSSILTGYHSVYLHNGNLSVKETNSSKNKVTQGSSIYVSTSLIYFICHNTFCNSSTSHGICLGVSDCSGSTLYCNIVSNDCPLNGVIYVSKGDHIIDFSIFDSNQQVLFFVFIGNLYVTNCFISHYVSISIGVNNSYIKYPSMMIVHFDTQYCQADLPLPLKSPLFTISETIIRTYDDKCEYIIIQTKMYKDDELYIYPVLLSMLFVFSF